MSTFQAMSAVLVVGVLTYVSRAGLIVLLADRTMPYGVERALRYVGPAVLSALVVSLVAGGEGTAGVDVEEVAALVAGCVVAVRTRNLIAALAVGMVVLWVLTWLL